VQTEDTGTELKYDEPAWPKRIDYFHGWVRLWNARKQESAKAQSDHVFGQSTENGKNILAGRYARVSTDDQQTLAMQTDLCRSKFT
jgi:hypothetical protein